MMTKARFKTLELKALALEWLRFEKKYKMVCSELVRGQFIADVFGLGPRLPVPDWSLEIEIKISKSDLNNDFVKKSFKHEMNTARLPNCPNYFYFMVPEELVGYAIDLVGAKNTNYGILTTSELFGGVRVCKKATKIHTLQPTSALFQNVVRRMGNEIVTLTQNRLSDIKESNDSSTHGSEAIREERPEPIQGQDI